MPQLHVIASAKQATDIIFSGLYGEVVDGKFQFDASLQALDVVQAYNAQSPDAETQIDFGRQFLVFEGSDEVIAAVKSNLLASLGSRWGSYYEQLASRMSGMQKGMVQAAANLDRQKVANALQAMGYTAPGDKVLKLNAAFRNTPVINSYGAVSASKVMAHASQVDGVEWADVPSDAGNVAGLNDVPFYSMGSYGHGQMTASMKLSFPESMSEEAIKQAALILLKIQGNMSPSPTGPVLESANNLSMTSQPIESAEAAPGSAADAPAATLPAQLPDAPLAPAPAAVETPANEIEQSRAAAQRFLQSIGVAAPATGTAPAADSDGGDEADPDDQTPAM